MKTGLSRRESILIFIAASAILVMASFKYVIIPLYNHYSDKLEEYDIISTEKMMLDLKFQNEELTLASHDNAETEFNEIAKRYPTVMPNEEIDRILTGMCLKNNLNPITLSISDATEFFFKEEAVETEDSVDEDEAPKPPAFLIVNAKMSLHGDYASLKSLISAVEKSDNIRICQTTFTYKQAEDKTDTPNISVLFEVMMLNDTL